MDSNKIKLIILGIVATLVALYLGITAATAQFEAIAWVMAGLVTIICIALGKRVWLLLPLMSALGITIQIPGQPSSGLLAQVLVLVFCLPIFLLRRLPWQFAMREMEAWILILTLFVVQVYVRHPVGVNLFGGASVGGKPYAVYAICLVSGLLLGGLKASENDLKWILRLSILGGLLNLVISMLGALVPTVGYYTDANKSAEAGHEDYGTVVDVGAATRIGFLGGFSHNLALWISSYVSPLRACLNPLLGTLILFSVFAALMSGFRNSVIDVGLVLLLGIIYRSGFSGSLVSIGGGICGVGLLAVVNVIHPLPPNIQRSLTFLPGTWEERYRKDAEGSTEWRVEIWKEVLLTDRWIDNKWLGDGLGFKASELAQQMNYRKGSRMGTSGFEAHREAILSNGDYHSGPVQTIRTIGYVGLLFLLIAQARLAVHAHRQMHRCRNTEWYPLALFVGIPLIVSPIFFVLVFGSFTTAFTGLFMGYGMVSMLEKNLPLPAYVKRSRQPFELQKVNRARL